LEEIEGIAEGCGRSYEEIMKLNFCEEIWNETTGWCTNICVIDTPDGAILGKNNDVGSGDEKFHILQYVKPNKGFSFIRGTFTGTIWTIAGINETGLSLGESRLKVKRILKIKEFLHRLSLR